MFLHIFSSQTFLDIHVRHDLRISFEFQMRKTQERLDCVFIIRCPQTADLEVMSSYEIIVINYNLKPDDGNFNREEKNKIIN